MSDLSEDPIVRYRQFRDDPWLFLKHCVYTHDEVDTENPIKPYPSHLKYLFFVVQMFQLFKKLALPKSRRLTISWTVIALIVWDVIFHKGRSWAMTSKKEGDAGELVSRAEFIINHIPEDMIPKELIPKMKNGKMTEKPPTIEFDEINSRIEGFPSGADQLRQRGFSGIFEDETAYQKNAEKTYAAAEPTIRGGGRFIKVSSRAMLDKGFFKKVVFDRLDAKNNMFAEVPPVEKETPMEGVETWLNPKNKFLVIDLHYTANPEKRGDAFKQALEDTMTPDAYQMEYEKKWQTFEGKPVYDDFNEKLHVSTVASRNNMGSAILLGWKTRGLVPACVIAKLEADRLFVLKEIIGEEMDASSFVPFVKSEIALSFQVINFSQEVVSFVDPEMFNPETIHEDTYMRAFIKHGFKKIRPGAVTWNKRKESVSEYLKSMSQGKPRMVIYEKDCPVLVTAFKGGFRYPKSIKDAEPEKLKPLRDEYCNPSEALQMLCSGLSTGTSDLASISIPTPSYGFQKQAEIKPKRKLYGPI